MRVKELIKTKKRKQMKRKWIALIAALFFISVAFSSCHTTTPCPAYAQKQNSEKPYQKNINLHQKIIALHHQ